LFFYKNVSAVLSRHSFLVSPTCLAIALVTAEALAKVEATAERPNPQLKTTCLAIALATAEELKTLKLTNRAVGVTD